MFVSKLSPAERPVRIRDAVAHEAGAIGSLVRGVFDARYLLSSPYASESGDVLLASQLTDPRETSALRTIRVATVANRLEGVAISSNGAEGLSLDFIASRGVRGVGSALLNDAKKLSNGRVTLNVFKTNGRARDFYAKRGFSDAGSVWFRVVGLDALSASGATAAGDLHEVCIRARQDEAEQGFGNLALAIDSVSYHLGIVGGKSIRVQSATGDALVSLAQILREVFPERLALVLPADTSAQGLPILFEDELVTMEWTGD